MDTAGAWLIQRLVRTAQEKGAGRASRRAERGHQDFDRRGCRRVGQANAQGRKAAHARDSVPRGDRRARLRDARRFSGRHEHTGRHHPRRADEARARPRHQHGRDLLADRPHGRRRDPGGGADVGHRRRDRRAAGRLPALAISAPTYSWSTSSASWCCANSAC